VFGGAKGGQGFSTSVTEQAAPNELETTTPSDGADEVSVEDSTTNKVTTADHASDAFKDEYGVENRIINGKSAVNAGTNGHNYKRYP
jgi:hypothetical protein